MCKKDNVRVTFLFFFICCFVVLIFGSLYLIGSPVYAGDELYLTGIVKSVDVNSGTIVVDVQSQSCPGLRRFSVEDASGLQGLNKGEKVSFTIDGSACKDNAIYKIMSLIRNGG
jgi:hypothetical protein